MVVPHALRSIASGIFHATMISAPISAWVNPNTAFSARSQVSDSSAILFRTSPMARLRSGARHDQLSDVVHEGRGERQTAERRDQIRAQRFQRRGRRHAVPPQIDFRVAEGGQRPAHDCLQVPGKDLLEDPAAAQPYDRVPDIVYLTGCA